MPEEPQSISLCVVELAGRERKIIERRKFRYDQEEPMAEYFAALGEYQRVVEATSSYEWFVQLVEPTADRVVLAHLCCGPVVRRPRPARRAIETCGQTTPVVCQASAHR